jgi:hypothetical protein
MKQKRKGEKLSEGYILLDVLVEAPAETDNYRAMKLVLIIGGAVVYVSVVTVGFFLIVIAVYSGVKHYKSGRKHTVAVAVDN